MSGRPPVTASAPAARPVFMNSRLVKSAIWLLHEARTGHMLPSPQLNGFSSGSPVDIHRTPMYKTSTYGHEQGPGCCVRHPARARHPCRRRQLRLRHHQASGRAVGRASTVDRRHALSRAAPARAPGSCRGEVVRVRERPPAQVLPDHQRRPGAARCPAAAVAGRARYPAGYLDERVHGMTTFADRPLEEQIAQWREYVRRRPALHGPDVEELEGHLRDQLAALTKAGLAGDEAFLVAVKRMGSLDALSREFARA